MFNSDSCQNLEFPKLYRQHLQLIPKSEIPIEKVQDLTEEQIQEIIRQVKIYRATWGDSHCSLYKK